MKNLTFWKAGLASAVGTLSLGLMIALGVWGGQYICRHRTEKAARENKSTAIIAQSRDLADTQLRSCFEAIQALSIALEGYGNNPATASLEDIEAAEHLVHSRFQYLQESYTLTEQKFISEKKGIYLDPRISVVLALIRNTTQREFTRILNKAKKTWAEDFEKQNFLGAKMEEALGSIELVERNIDLKFLDLRRTGLLNLGRDLLPWIHFPEFDR